MVMLRLAVSVRSVSRERPALAAFGLGDGAGGHIGEAGQLGLAELALSADGSQRRAQSRRCRCLGEQGQVVFEVVVVDASLHAHGDGLRPWQSAAVRRVPPARIG